MNNLNLYNDPFLNNRDTFFSETIINWNEDNIEINNSRDTFFSEIITWNNNIGLNNGDNLNPYPYRDPFSIINNDDIFLEINNMDINVFLEQILSELLDEKKDEDISKKIGLMNIKYGEIKNPDIPLECSICYEKFDMETPVPIISCNHYFHFQCLKNWCNIKNNCPLCRKIIPIKSSNC